MLCLILGAHLLLFYLISMSDRRRSQQRDEDDLATLFLIDLSDPDDTQPTTKSSSRRPISTRDPSVESKAAREDTISLPTQVEGTDTFIDWDAEASRVARDAAVRMGDEKKLRALDQHPAGMAPPPPKDSLRRLGDSEHYEGGVIIDWISNRCYYSNQDAPIAAFGQALRLQLPTCTGRGTASAEPLQTFEEWRKERRSSVP